ncbi:enoyl-CoA hydratase/isomerase family protein [Aliikangiella marina]|uniref:Enoyl-CoA hydratase/isomerase family protein n=1 Tax=Aliikangiella marina TaxID=1712262 RepID=A0A545TJV4_9GAMM|nr:enoyl-CoA hydratase/isomerase family protein [Aliikangiella marina]TQV77510.1 enoyl-CoA hydratase/isomerase family protein [Aliikangiella marina]
MSENSIVLERSANGLVSLTLNRPDVHNAFDDKLIADLTRVIQRLDEDPKVRVLALKAEGKSFSAGADLNWMKRMANYSWEQNYQDSLQLAGLMQALHDFSKTTVAIVQGAAYGGGVGLVACCDIALASERAIFCLSEVKLGLIPAVISPYVVKAIGERNAKRYFATAESFNASEAKHIGLVHKVIRVESFDAEVNDYLQKMLSNGPNAMYQAKRLVEFVYNKPINEELIRETAQRIADTRASKEGKEGVSAFLEKRPAQWLDAQSEKE